MSDFEVPNQLASAADVRRFLESWPSPLNDPKKILKTHLAFPRKQLVPPELLIDVLSNLETRDLLRAVLVSKLWRNVAQTLIHRSISIPRDSVGRLLVQCDRNAWVKRKTTQLDIVLGESQWTRLIQNMSDDSDSDDLEEEAKRNTGIVRDIINGSEGLRQVDICSCDNSILWEALTCPGLIYLKRLRIDFMDKEDTDFYGEDNLNSTFPFTNSLTTLDITIEFPTDEYVDDLQALFPILTGLLLPIITLVHLNIAVADQSSITHFLRVLVGAQNPHLKSLVLNWLFPIASILQILPAFPNLDSFTSSRADPVLLKHLPVDLKNWTIVAPEPVPDTLSAQMYELQALVKSNALKDTRIKLERILIPSEEEIDCSMSTETNFPPYDKLGAKHFRSLTLSYKKAIKKLSEQARQKGILIETLRYR